MPSTDTRGCYECTKRRIICDATEPSCKKCQKKGIECSGLSRFRFAAGIAKRGRWKGCPIPVADVSPESALERQRQAERSVPRRIRWRAPDCREDRAVKAASVAADTTEASSSPSDEADEQDQNLDEVVGHDRELVVLVPSVSSWIAPLCARTRMLFSHFSCEVAPVMVVLDSICNGYRDVLLPLACEDELLQRAITAVAAQHLALLQPDKFQSLAEFGRATVISQLRRNSSSPDRVFNVSTWATLVVLLVGETITGSSDYSHLLHILDCLARNINQITPSAATRFLTQQTHMFQFLGQPLLGESTGINALRLPPDHYLDWTHYDIPAESEHNRTLHLSRQAFIKASQVYICRATTNADQWNLLESLKHLVSEIGPDVQGSHALVWVCFIGAADSTDPEHRRFFTDRMTKVFAKTRFRNISAALDSLQTIWSQHGLGRGRWTENVTRLAPTLVM